MKSSFFSVHVLLIQCVGKMKLDATPVFDNAVKKKNAPAKKSTIKTVAKKCDFDVIKAAQSTCSADQHFSSGPLEQPFLAGALGMQPDPLLLVALHVSAFTPIHVMPKSTGSRAGYRFLVILGLMLTETAS